MCADALFSACCRSRSRSPQVLKDGLDVPKAV
jgi:hypothetical protein